jgi:hypothetical protein
VRCMKRLGLVRIAMLQASFVTVMFFRTGPAPMTSGWMRCKFQLSDRLFALRHYAAP